MGEFPPFDREQKSIDTNCSVNTFLFSVNTFSCASCVLYCRPYKVYALKNKLKKREITYMCDEDNSRTRHAETITTLRQMERLLLSTVEHPDIDKTVAISAAQPFFIDYAERRRLYIISNTSVILTVEDVATVFVPANTWTDIGFQEGQRIFYPGSSTAVTFLIRATDRIHEVVPQSGPFVGPAITAYPSNVTATATAGADTVYKFGTNGNQQVQHVVIQNNTGSSLFYAFDQSTTVSGNMVYTLVNGGIVFWDRAVTILHFSSAASQSFGGTTGISVEAFL